MTKPKMEVAAVTQGSRRLDGSYGDIVTTRCPCGAKEDHDVYECCNCGPAISGTLDNEIFCGGCSRTYELESDEISVHCPEPNEVNCPDE